MFYKSLRFIIFSFVLFLPTLSFSQKIYIKAHKGLKGNTGFRGNILPEDSTHTIAIRDFYIIQFKAINSCTVVVDSMYVVLSGDQKIRLCPTFLNCATEMRISAGETISVRAEKKEDDIMIESSAPTASVYKGKLFATVNGEPVELTVQRFENIFED